MDEKPNFKRATVITVGILYLLATITSVAGFSLIQSVTDSADRLSIAYPQKGKLALGVLFQLINDGAVVAIGILLHGILRRYSENIATGVLSTRILEGGILAIGKLSLFLLMTISLEYINPDTTTTAHLATLGTLAIKWNAWSFEFAMIALGIGGMALCYLLFKTRLVPIPISILGIAGYMLLFTRSILSILGYPQGFTLFFPVALFELVFPIWIITRGFDSAGASVQIKEKSI